ncbi:UNVERIFIED_ORG: hypothetical protein GGI66_005777 [Rhizobium esperanzae]
MDIEAYRREYLASLEAANRTAGSAPVTAQSVASYVDSGERDATKICEMINAMPLDADEYDVSIRTLLNVAGDETLDASARKAALNKLGAAEFQPSEFADFHAEYIALLRRLAVDPNRDIRIAALDRLTLTGDVEAQKLLREGLENIRKPLVSAAKAIQLLARDDHGGSLSVFRALATEATGQVREQALRALAADQRSVPLFEKIVADKEEKTRIREIAAMNLKSTSIKRFADAARKLVLDDEEDDRLKAAAVSAIAHTSEAVGKVASKTFVNALENLGSATKSRALKSSINRLSKALKER